MREKNSMQHFIFTCIFAAQLTQFYAECILSSSHDCLRSSWKNFAICNPQGLIHNNPQFDDALSFELFSVNKQTRQLFSPTFYVLFSKFTSRLTRYRWQHSVLTFVLCKLFFREKTGKSRERVWEYERKTSENRLRIFGGSLQLCKNANF